MSTPNPKAERLLKQLETPDYHEEHEIEVDLPEYIRITAKELKSYCSANPEHPKAVALLASVEDLPETTKVNVHRIDLIGIVKNCEVERRHVGGGYYRKSLGEDYAEGCSSESLPEALREPDEDPDLGSTSPAD